MSLIELGFALRGDLDDFVKRDVRAAEMAVTSVIRRKTTQVKNRVRKDVVRAGLGDRLAKTVRGQAFPERGRSINAAGQVFSKATFKGSRRAGGFVDLITVFDEGATIRARSGAFLAIPLPAAGTVPSGGRGAPRRPQPSDFSPGRLVLVETARGAVLIERGSGQVFFVLVREVRLRKRIDLARQLSSATANLDVLVARAWERNARRLGIG